MIEDRISEGVSIQLPSGGQFSRAVDNPDNHGKHPLSEGVWEHPHYGPIARQAYTHSSSALLLNGQVEGGSAIPTDWRTRRANDPTWGPLLQVRPLLRLRSPTWWSLSLVLSSAGMAALAGLSLQLDTATTFLVSLVVAALAQTLYAVRRSVWLLLIPLTGATLSFWGTDESTVTIVAAWLPLATICGTFLAFQRLDPPGLRPRVRDWLTRISILALVPAAIFIQTLIGRNPWPWLMPESLGKRPDAESTTTDAANAATAGLPPPVDRSATESPQGEAPEGRRSTPDPL